MPRVGALLAAGLERAARSLMPPSAARALPRARPWIALVEELHRECCSPFAAGERQSIIARRCRLSGLRSEGEIDRVWQWVEMYHSVYCAERARR